MNLEYTDYRCFMASFSKGKYSITKSVLFSMIIPHNVVENFYKESKVEEKMIELFTKLKELNITYQIILLGKNMMNYLIL